jgi:hypothetical protein
MFDLEIYLFLAHHHQRPELVPNQRQNTNLVLNPHQSQQPCSTPRPQATARTRGCNPVGSSADWGPLPIHLSHSPHTFVTSATYTTPRRMPLMQYTHANIYSNLSVPSEHLHSQQAPGLKHLSSSSKPDAMQSTAQNSVVISTIHNVTT